MLLLFADGWLSKLFGLGQLLHFMLLTASAAASVKTDPLVLSVRSGLHVGLPTCHDSDEAAACDLSRFSREAREWESNSVV